MNYTTIKVNNVTYQFTTESVKNLDVFINRAGEEIVIEYPTEVKVIHLASLAKILEKKVMIPRIDCGSHKMLLDVIKLAKFIGVPADTISAAFINWTRSPKWLELCDVQYMYLLYAECEELVDFRKFFREIADPFDALLKTDSVKEYNENPELYIDMLTFFKNINFALCFDENNVEIQEYIDRQIRNRKEFYSSFLVDPHAINMQNYFRFTPTADPVWDCKNISVVAAPNVGDPTIAPREVALERMSDFTYGMLDKPLNTDVTTPFPFDNVIIAGGSVAKVLGVNYNKNHAKRSDADLFIFGKTHEVRARVFEEVINWFKTTDSSTKVSRTYYALRGSVTTIYIKDIQRKFQVISANYIDPFEVMCRFDLSHIQWCMWKGRFFGTPEACRAARERITRVNNIRRLKIQRLIKALHCGYSIFKDPTVIENHFDITELVDDPSGYQTQKMIRDLYGWYYPVTMPDMSPEEECQHNLCMIERDANASLVTTDHGFALNNVVVSGNFDNDYESTLFSTFNPTTIANGMQGRREGRIMIKSKFGVIRLTTPVLKVHDVLRSDAGIDVCAKSDDVSFHEFCQSLDRQIYQMMRGAEGVTRSVINGDGVVTFTVPRHKIEYQLRCGVSCLRNQRGVPLNIEEDLRVGDDIQVMFAMEVMNYPNLRAIELRPLKFITYQKYDPAEAKRPVEDIATTQAIEFEGEITYEEPGL